MPVIAAAIHGLTPNPTSGGVLCLPLLRWSLVAALFMSLPAGAQTTQTPQERLLLNAARSWVTNSELEAHTRFIASDALLGRAPGTQGGRVAADYIASQFERIGLEPGGNEGTYFQHVPLLGLRPNPVVLVGDGSSTMALSYPDDFVAKPERPDSFLISGGNVLFVGYGIQAPEYDWDDFKDVDVTGRVLFVLPNDPGHVNPDLFRNVRSTIYTEIDYKLEQAAALGATGVFFVHSDAVPLPWDVVRNRWNREIILPIQSSGDSELDFTGWISLAAAQKIAAASGLDWNVLQRRASLREFRPTELGLHLAIDITSDMRTFEASNVVGMIRGHEVPARSVILTAHYDYLGVSRGAPLDSIFNGARGNAANIAALITTAAAFTSAGISTPTTLRFVAPTAGESGALGLESFLWSLSANHESAQAAIVFEEPNLWGPTADIGVGGQSGIDTHPNVQSAALLEGLVPGRTADAFRLGNHGDTRSALEAVRIPFIAIGSGRRLPDDAPSARGLAIDAYYQRHFGRTSDNMLPDFDFDGLRAQVRFVINLAWELSRVAAATTN